MKSIKISKANEEVSICITLRIHCFHLQWGYVINDAEMYSVVGGGRMSVYLKNRIVLAKMWTIWVS